ncbi:MAG: metal-dependent hydrolase [Hyphomicrobiales bacterium]|nr:metal-dependent hydrolase [Hyphomicrobiales bacterium]
MKITWFGHSSFSVEFASTKILIDPFLKGNPSFDESGFEAAIADTTHIVLTHGHGDHVGDTVEIAQRPDIPVIANFDLCMWLNAKGVKKIDPTNTGGMVAHPGFTVTFVQAIHSSAHLDEDGTSHALGNSCGVVLHIDGEKTIYHMGDTDIFGDMALIQELHQPQIGIVPIGDRFTMGGKVAALACQRYFKFETIIPCHYASFGIVDQNADKFVAGLGGDGDKALVMTSGQTIDV